MSKPRILIVENDPKWRENYCEIVNKLGYEAFVAEGVGDELISDALNKCKNNRCHVAVVDLHLRDDSDKYDDSGVDDVALQIGPTSVIIASGLIDVTKTNSIRDKAAEKKLEFHYFDKGGKGQRGEKAPQILSPMIQKLARSKSSIANGTSLRVSPRFFQLQLDQFLARMGFSYHIDKGQELIADLLVQLVRPDGEASELELVPLEDSVGSSSSAVSRNSFVARVKLKGSRRRDFVVKFAKPYAIAAEHRNYMDFVYRRIPWQSYAGLDEKPALFWEIGAIGLDLVGRALPFSTKYHLAEVTSDSSMKSILEAISDLSDNWTHYKQTAAQTDSRKFLETYMDVWDKNKVGVTDTFLKRFEPGKSEESWELPISEWNFIAITPLPNPIVWLRKKYQKESAFIDENFATQITHGDAWGENIFVTNLGATIWIDFERTGTGYVLQDFARLEFDVMTRLIRLDNDEATLRALFCLYIAVLEMDELGTKIDMVSPNPEIQKAILIINQIRRKASLHAQGVSDVQQYLVAILFNVVFRCTLRVPDFVNKESERTWNTEKSRALLLGGLIVDKFEARKSPWSKLKIKKLFKEESFKVWLREKFIAYPLTRQTVEGLAFEILGKSPDELSSDTLDSMKRSLFKFCEESRQLSDLHKAIQKQFPEFSKGINVE